MEVDWEDLGTRVGVLGTLRVKGTAEEKESLLQPLNKNFIPRREVNKFINNKK